MGPLEQRACCFGLQSSARAPVRIALPASTTSIDSPQTTRQGQVMPNKSWRHFREANLNKHQPLSSPLDVGTRWQELPRGRRSETTSQGAPLLLATSWPLKSRKARALEELNKCGHSKWRVRGRATKLICAQSHRPHGMRQFFCKRSIEGQASRFERDYRPRFRLSLRRPKWRNRLELQCCQVARLSSNEHGGQSN